MLRTKLKLFPGTLIMTMLSTMLIVQSASGSVQHDTDDLLRRIPDYDPIATADTGYVSVSDPAKSGPYYFDNEAAQRVLNFFPDMLHFVEGRTATQPFYLETWQAAIVANTYGWKRPDGTRRYRKVFIFVPRKNGKTPFTAGIALYMLVADGEYGVKAYSAAASRDQASIVYEHAAGMVELEPILKNSCKPYRTSKSIEYRDELGLQNIFRSLSADADLQQGKNASLAIIDELHVHKNDQLLHTLTSSMGTRLQPLTVITTTSDFERESVCNIEHLYATQVRDGIIEDAQYLPIIYEANDKEDDWTDRELWKRVNPNLGVSIQMDFLESEFKEAQNKPSFVNTFKRYYLNMKTQALTQWLDMDRWLKCAGDLTYDQLAKSLEGRQCFAGLDLSAKLDLTSFVLVFPIDGGFDILPTFWLPAMKLIEREKIPNSPSFTAWERAGYLKTIPGEVIVDDVILDHIKSVSELYNIKEIGFDRWGSSYIVNGLAAAGLEVTEFGQGYASISEPSKEFEKRVVAGELRHANHPVLKWNAANVMIEEDHSGNIKPSKKMSKEKIDGILATIMGLGLAVADAPEEESIYNTQGLDIL